MEKYACDYKQLSKLTNTDISDKMVSLLMSVDLFYQMTAPSSLLELDNLCISSILIAYEPIEKRDQGSIQFNEATKTTWNTYGSSLSRSYFHFPVIYLSDVESETIEATAASINRDKTTSNIKAKHQVHVNFYMGPKNMTSKKCMRQGKCQPLGGLSSWGILGSYPKPAKKIVLAATNTDSSAIFHDMAFGANSAVSGIVTLLSAAEALTAVRGIETDNSIAFALFRGEMYDRTGSLRFVKDIVSFQGCRSYTDKHNVSCFDPPTYSLEWTKLSNNANFKNESDIFSSVIVVDQILGDVFNSNLHLHVIPGSASSLNLANNIMKASSANPSLVNIHNSKPLPSESTLQTFVLSQPWTTKKAALTDTGVILAGYDDNGYGKQFRSIFDVIDTKNDTVISKATEKIAHAATILSRSLFKAANPSSSDLSLVNNIVVKSETVKSLLLCFLQDFSCDTVAKVVNMTKEDIQSIMESSSFAANYGPSNGGPLSLYTGTYSPFAVEAESVRLSELFIRNYLAIQMGTTKSNVEKVCSTDLDCKKLGDPCVKNTNAASNSTLLCISGLCACSNAWFHDSWSPGLKITDDKYDFDNQSISSLTGEMMEIWTEPYWATPEVFVYMKTDNTGNWVALAIGLLVVLVSIFIPCKRLHL